MECRSAVSSSTNWEFRTRTSASTKGNKILRAMSADGRSRTESSFLFIGEDLTSVMSLPYFCLIVISKKKCRKTRRSKRTRLKKCPIHVFRIGINRRAYRCRAPVFNTILLYGRLVRIRVVLLWQIIFLKK